MYKPRIEYLDISEKHCKLIDHKLKASCLMRSARSPSEHLNQQKAQEDHQPVSTRPFLTHRMYVSVLLSPVSWSLVR